MKQISILGGKAHVVEAAPEWVDFYINPKFSNKLSWVGLDGIDFLILPPGTWQIVGMLSEVTEEQLDGLVESDGVTYAGLGEEVFSYPNHCGGPSFGTRLESLSTAIYSLDWYFDNPYQPPTPKIWQTNQTMYMRMEKDYTTAQSRVLFRERCLLLRRVDG